MADKEFTEKCMKTRTITILPTVTLISRGEQTKSLAQQHQNNSKYFMEGAKNLVNSNTPLLVALVGYFAMEHKANQLLALQGYKIESHICVQMALSRIVGRKDLARKLSEMFESRQNIGYRMFLENNEEGKILADKMMKEEIIPFLEEIHKLIEEVE